VGSSRARERAQRTQLTVAGQVCRLRIVGRSIINQAGPVTSRGPVAAAAATEIGEEREA
jgi:hypothetical protein